jgi:hypothetical protein
MSVAIRPLGLWGVKMVKHLRPYLIQSNKLVFLIGDSFWKKLAHFGELKRFVGEPNVTSLRP